MGEDALKNAEDFVISDEEFQSFISRHNTMKCLVPESNEKVSAAFYRRGNNQQIFYYCFYFADAQFIFDSR